MPDQTATPQANTQTSNTGAAAGSASTGGQVGVQTNGQAAPTFELKVDGKVINVTEAQLRAYAQKGLFADKALKSVDVLKNSTSNLINKLKTPEGLWEVLNDPALGANPKAVFKKLMASGIVDDELKDEMGQYLYNNDPRINKSLTPEQLEQRRKLEEYERMKSDEQKRKEADLTAQQKAQVDRIYQGVRAEVSKQILADKTFPQTEGSIRQVVEKLRVMNRQGVAITTESVTKALDLVKKDHFLHQQTMFDAIQDPEELIKFLGEDRALKISKALVARLKGKQAVKSSGSPAVRTEGKEKITDALDKKFGRNRQGYAIMDV